MPYLYNVEGSRVKSFVKENIVAVNTGQVKKIKILGGR